MPELPEVEHIVRYLRPRLATRTITGAAPSFPGLRGRTIEAVRRRAKLVLVDLDDGSTLAIHLKLTGKLWVRAEPGPKARLALRLDDGQALVLEDARRLGWVRRLDALGLDRLLAPLGPEPLEPGFDLAALRARLARRRGRLKPLLLDPTFVAGVGNIYADEVLFAARLHPRRTSASLAPADVARLHRALVSTLRRALDARTDEVPDQERVGAGGRGAAERISGLKVFQRAGRPCPRCKTTITRSVVQGRGTYTCPACQRMPAGA